MTMSSSRAAFWWSPPSPALPADHVLKSGAVIFPGAFDQHGCPLLMFPAETQCKLSEEVSGEEVSQFILYCLRLHNKKGEEGLVSVVADLRRADVTVVKFITETLLTLEVYRRIFHSVYFVQPKKKSVQKLLGKLLTQSSKQKRPVLFKRVFLKDVCELSNFMDRSQLSCSLGGYLMYCHDSWVNFIKEIDAFVQEFLCVVNRLPSCISTLQSLAKLPVPGDFEQLREFCSVNEARFQQLRRDLGLDDLLKCCECLLEKLRFPENEPCFHAMAGTILFSHTALEMLQNYNRLSAAVEKVELLWQQAFSKPRLQLQVAHLQREAQQIQEQIVVLHREKVQPYRIQPAEDVHRSESLRLEFESLIYMHAMALVRRAEDVLHTLSESVQLTDVREPWVHDLHRMKENLRSSVQHLYQTLRNVSDFHYTLNRCRDWYKQVLCETFLSDLSQRREGVCERSFTPEGLMWRRGMETFLRRSSCPEVHELVKLTHLTDVISDPNLQHAGKQLSHRCMTLRRLLTSSVSVSFHDLQLALQWQYEYLMSNHTTSDITSLQTDQNKSGLRDSSFMSNSVPHGPLVSQSESLFDLAKWPSVGDCEHQVSPSGAPGAGKPPSLSSFDSGFDGAGSSHLDTRNRREGLSRFPGNGDSKPVYAQIHEENVASVSDSEDPECSLNRDTPQASIQIFPKITSDSVNLEIKVKRSATLPKNPWLSLPIDDLESSYTVTITPNSSNQQRIIKSSGLSTNTHDAEQTSGTRDPRCVCDKRPERENSFEDSEVNPIINVLSSTITDPEENTVDAEASLLWDTFDLHNLRHDSCERLDASLFEWVQREQEDLHEVEKTLERAAEILQEEENVLAQEVMLDELLETEDVIKQGPVWSKDQHGEMSLQDLVQSGVIGLDDEISSSLPVSPRSQLPSSDSDTQTSEIFEKRSGSRRSITESLTCVDVPQKVDKSDIIQDLQVLEVQILEERFQLEALRLGESEPLALSHVTTRSSCRERRMFLAHLEEERQDVVKMERSFRRERVKKRVVRCSIMEKNSMRKDLWSSDTEEKLQHADTSRLKEMNTSPTPQDEKQECTEVTNKSQSSLSSPAPPDSTSQSEINQDVRFRYEESDTSDLWRSSGTDSPSSVHPERSSNPPADEISSCPAETQQTNPENGAFDPGGAPVPAPRRVFFEAQTQERSESISGSIDLIQTPDQITRCLHMHNNNNNTLVQSYQHDGHSETQQNISTVMANTTEAQQEQSAEAEWEETGQMLGRERNEGGVYDGCGSTRAVFGSLLDRPQLNTSNRPLDYQTPIVLDTGSGLMKAGFADQDLPTVVFPTVIGHPKYEEVMSGGVDRDVYVGHDARHMRGVLTLKHPIRNGIVRNWDEMEMIWHHAFQQLSVDPQDHPVMLTEAARNPLENRQRMIELMFETFNVPLTFVAMQAVLALYASGRTTGVVLDSGDGVSHSVPVFDGHCLPHAVQRFNLAGADVTLQLQKLLQEQGVCMQTSAELEIVREMKEKCCFVALDYESQIRNGGTASSEVQYTLPDGRIVSLCTERFRAPEVLFKPGLIGRDHYGMHESVFKSILQSDIDLRRSFFGNMVLSGGNTLLAGLPERLQMEIRHMVPADLMESVRVTSPSDRDFSVWCGGAVLANLPVFSSAWITSDEYEEFGPQIVFRKCF